MRFSAALLVIGLLASALPLLASGAQAGGSCTDVQPIGNDTCPGAFCYDAAAPRTRVREDCDVYLGSIVVYVPQPPPIDGDG